jgi:enamine deaminase RidA (YjgF/YER057c/UK114 family)
MFTPLPNEVITERKSCLATTNDNGIDFVRRHDHRQESTGNEPDRAAQPSVFKTPRPARVTVGVAALAVPTAHVEIMVTAQRQASKN